MTVTEIATQIYTELGSPTSNSVAAIEYWLRSKVGELNTLLFEDFSLVSDEIVDGDGNEIGINAAAILKKLYKVYDYEVQIRAQISAVGVDTILSVSDQGSSVTKINRNEVSKTLASVKKDEQAELNNLITAYRMHGATPSQVTGDDTVDGSLNPTIRIR